MGGRTFAIGDIHGEWSHFLRVWSQLPTLDAKDTVVFLGDYLDRGSHSKEVIETLMALPKTTPARVVFLRGNHEDAWLRVCGDGWDEFVLQPDHGCLPMLRSFVGKPAPRPNERATHAEMALLTSGKFLPDKVVKWMEQLPFWHEDEHGLYVHAGLSRGPHDFLHPSETKPLSLVAWIRTEDFTRNYRGKKVLFGHTPVGFLPAELSAYTPDDPDDVWLSDHIVGLDTGCGLGGFLTAIELPAMRVFESRRVQEQDPKTNTAV